MRVRGGGSEGDPGMTERRTVWWEEGRVRMIDQTRLPGELVILDLETYEAVAEAIRSMRVRGAPAIGVTAAWGAGVGVVGAAVESGGSLQVLVEERRPGLEGMRLTAWGFRQDGIPARVITDSMAGWVMGEGGVQSVIVGADRMAANGYTA